MFYSNSLFSVSMMPWVAFGLLFFAIFGGTDKDKINVHKIVEELCPSQVRPDLDNLLTTTALAPIGPFRRRENLTTTTTTPAPIFIPGQPEWTEKLYVVAFLIYQIVAVVVLINLLIAMMSDTYQRIQSQ
uniref:Ion transport domain-containing protein n=1 Tax=Cacopsylla melanoneura TaxID=428564 RepID=A0A8D9E4V8_9HEMI